MSENGDQAEFDGSIRPAGADDQPSRLRALIVDDAEGMRAYLASLFELRGFDVDTCDNGGRALTLLKSLPLEGAIITGDAAFCQRVICQAIRDGGGDYLFTVKANQPRLMADIAIAFGDVHAIITTISSI